MDSILDFIRKIFVFSFLFGSPASSSMLLMFASGDCRHISSLIGWDLIDVRKHTHKCFRNLRMRNERIQNERFYRYAVSPGSHLRWKYPHTELDESKRRLPHVIMANATFTPILAFTFFICFCVPLFRLDLSDIWVLFYALAALLLFVPSLLLHVLFRRWMHKCEKGYGEKLKKSDEEAKNKLHNRFRSDDQQ